jgi:hypothetical protein
MADGDELVIGENNQAQSATQLVLGLGNPSTTLLRVGTGGGASIGVHGEGAIGIHGKGGTGVSGEGDIGVLGTSKSQEGVMGLSNSGIGVSGTSKSDSGVLGYSDTGIGVQGSVGLSPFEVPSKVGVLGESNTGVGVQGHAFNDTGVLGRSVSGIGVKAESDGAYGVFASAPEGFGVNGEGVYGVRGASPSGFGVFGKCPKGYAGYFEGNVLIKGDLTKTGIGSSVAVRFPDRSFRRLCSIESPESWFEDFGEAKLVKGKAEVKIDPDFAKTVNLKTRYHVFVTPHSTKISALAVVARLPGRFRVEHPGGASGTFSYRVVAKRGDIRVRRLERMKMPAPTRVVPA